MGGWVWSLDRAGHTCAMSHVPDLTVVAIPLYILTMSLEAYLHWRRPRTGQQGYSWRDARTSIAMGLGSLVVGAIFAGVQLGFLMFFSRFAILDPGRSSMPAPDSHSWRPGSCCSWPMTLPTTGSIGSTTNRASSGRRMSPTTRRSTITCRPPCGSRGRP